MITLSSPRVISIVLGAIGVAWSGPTVVALVTGGRLNPVFTPVNLVIGAALILFAVRVAMVHVVLDDQQITVRSRMASRSWPWSAVRGIALVQDGGIPTLRVVLFEGDPVRVPAWSLHARHADGETEPAGPALQRFGADHGVAVRVRDLTGPVR